MAGWIECPKIAAVLGSPRMGDSYLLDTPLLDTPLLGTTVSLGLRDMAAWLRYRVCPP